MTLLGIDVLGADYGEIISTVFQAAGGAVDYAKHVQDENAAIASADSALAAAIAADQAATVAVGKAAMSALVAKADPSKVGALKADKAAADAAVAVQDRVGAALPEEKRAARVKAAQAAVDNATRRVAAARGSMEVVVQVELAAAKQTLAKAKGKEEKSNKAVEKSNDGESFLVKPLVGPVKWWHAIVGALAASAVVIARKRSHK